MRFDLHINQSLVGAAKIIELAKAIDKGSFSALWVLDHFAPLHGNTGHSMLEPFTLLGALSAETENINLGILVANVVNRTPPVLAQCATTLQHLSNNRFLLGLGAGASPQSAFAKEHHALGIELKNKMSERHQGLALTVNKIRDIWNRTNDGAVYILPPPVEPPITIGVNSPELAAIAARLQCAINVRWNHERLREIISAYVLHSQQTQDQLESMVSVWMPWTSDTHSLTNDFITLERQGVGKVIFLTMKDSDFHDLSEIHGRGAATFG